MKDFSKVMLSFIVGALAGAAAGVLLAPDKGKNTRKKVKKSIDDLSQKAKDSMDDLSAKVKESVDDLSAKTKKTFSKEPEVKDTKKA
jgi:gas vesicle protein